MKKTEELQIIVKIVDKESQVNLGSFRDGEVTRYAVSKNEFCWSLEKTKKSDDELKLHKQNLRKMNAIKKLLHKAKTEMIAQIAAKKLKIKELDAKNIKKSK